MALSATARDRLCCEIINQYLFDNVWNEPVSEYRINVHPSLITKYSQVGSFHVADANIFLPTLDESYFVWYMKSTDINLGLKLKSCVWYDTVSICNDFRTLIHTYSSSGNMLPKCSVFLRYNRRRSTIYIAIKKDALYKLTPTPPLNTIYLTFYYDSDTMNDVKVYSTYVTHRSRIPSIQSEVDNLLSTMRNSYCLTEFKNGIEITDVHNTPVLEVDSYYDYIVDNNIEFTFDVDLTNSSEAPVFLSELDYVWKQLIHIPRALNPNNEILTHNTCDFFIRRKRGKVYGRYLHRATTGRTVSQVTHNDMSIPLFIVDAYRDYLQTQDVVIHGVVRKHDKNNRLIRDACYIDLLYNEIHDDSDIIRFLSNENSTDITWWKASNLEKSTYVKMMFDTPNGVTIDNVSKYVDALGYYSVINLLCKRITDTRITNDFSGTLKFTLPLIYSGCKVVPIIYLNGKMLSFDKYEYTCDTDLNTCKISIDDSIYVPVGSLMSVEFFITDDTRMFIVTPGENDVYSFDIPYKNFRVFSRIEHVAENKGIATSSNYSYEEILPSHNQYIINQTSTGSRITFISSISDTEFLIQNSDACYTKRFIIDNLTDRGDNLVFPLFNTVSGSNENRPILDISNIAVFLNNDYLVRGIDYFINTVKVDGNECFSELVIQTMDHFKENASDKVEILINSTKMEELNIGFSINDKLTDKTPVCIFFPNISSVHINSRLERDAEYHGTYVEVPSGKYPEGSIFEIQTSVPSIVSDFVKKYSRNLDLQRIEILNNYFYKVTNVVPEILEMEGKHRIYSTFMNSFIRAILDGNVQVVNEPDLNRARRTIKPFLYLKDMDLSFTEIDKHFIDLYPQYVNYAIDPDTKNIIDRFIRENMPENTIPTMEVVYE